MLVESDAFTIRYFDDRVSVATIMEKIRALGYRPEIVERAGHSIEAPVTVADLPEPIAGAWEAAVKEGKMLLLDFYASWCGPCKILERNVMHSPRVKKALRDFVLLKVDTDRYPRAANHFRVKALPTLIVIDTRGSLRKKHVGLISVDELIEQLAAARQAAAD